MKIWNSRWLSLPLAAFVALGMSVPAAAQVLEIEPATEEAEGEAELEAAAQGGDMPNSGAVALGAGVDFASEYFFRGIVQETNGFIAQAVPRGKHHVWRGDDHGRHVEQPALGSRGWRPGDVVRDRLLRRRRVRGR